jgi:hypothetical protein
MTASARKTARHGRIHSYYEFATHRPLANQLIGTIENAAVSPA